MKSRQKQKVWDARKLRKGDSVIYKNIGYGLVSYESGSKDVIGISKGRLFTDTFDRIGMEWDERKKTWFFDSGLGLRTEIVDPADPVAAREVAEQA